MTDFPTLADLADTTDLAEATDAAPAAAPPPPPSARVQQMLEWLESEGFRARVDDDGDIHLRHESRDVFIVFDNEDPAYIRFVATDIWRHEDSAEQRRLALNVANSINGDLKAVKIWVRSNGAVFAFVESFVNGFEALRAAAPRCLDALGSARWEYRERFKDAQQALRGSQPEVTDEQA